MPSAQYWNLCGAVFAYLYAGLAEQGIDVLGASQLLGYPTQFPSVTLLDWRTGQPNARYRVLQLLHQNFGPGDRIVKATLRSPDIFVAAYVSPEGGRKVLLINKRVRPVDVRLLGGAGGAEEYVDTLTQGNVPASRSLDSDFIHLEGFSTMVATFPGLPSRQRENVQTPR
jgi:hypothetical protein